MACIPLRIKASIFTMVYGAHMISLIISDLISHWSLVHSLHYCHSALLFFKYTSHTPISGCLHLLFIFLKHSSSDVNQHHSLISFMSLLNISASVRPFLLETNPNYPTNSPHPLSMFISLQSTSFHMEYVFYLLLISPKRMLISTKGWVLSVLLILYPHHLENLEQKRHPISIY